MVTDHDVNCSELQQSHQSCGIWVVVRLVSSTDTVLRDLFCGMTCLLYKERGRAPAGLQCLATLAALCVDKSDCILCG